MKVVESFLTNNPYYTQHREITVKGLVLHSVGCPQPNALTFINQWNRADYTRACIHGFIDGNSGIVYQTLPWNYRAPHCGGSANNTHIGVEMCEPACIKYTGGASFTCSNREEALEVVKRTYDAAVELFASLCTQYHLDPLQDGVIISHKEGHDRGVASGHGDPDHLWNGMQCGYTMDGFRKDVAAAMGSVAATKSEKAADSAQSPAPEKSSAPAQSSGDNKIMVGDRVRLAPNAVYYGGKTMPDWVLSDTWIVKSITGDRVVIDQNVSGTRAICSPVSAAFLRLESRGGTGTAAAEAVDAVLGSESSSGSSAASASSGAAPAAGSSMQISERGVELVAKYEGCRLEAYKCPAGVWTIGYGHTAGVNEGDTLPSKETAKDLLKEDLAKYAASVNNCIKKGLLTFQPNQNQFDALTSFCYNCGAGNLQKLVSGRDAATIAEKLPEYNKGGGKVLPGLVKRREEERNLFLS